MKLEKPIQGKWISLPLMAIILLLSVVLIADYLYDWRDFRYEKLQGDYQVLEKNADLMAKGLRDLGNIASPEIAVQINGMLKSLGYSQYQVVIKTTVKEGK